MRDCNHTTGKLTYGDGSTYCIHCSDWLQLGKQIKTKAEERLIKAALRWIAIENLGDTADMAQAMAKAGEAVLKERKKKK
jgi:hypothetical protein